VRRAHAGCPSEREGCPDDEGAEDTERPFFEPDQFLLVENRYLQDIQVEQTHHNKKNAPDLYDISLIICKEVAEDRGRYTQGDEYKGEPQYKCNGMDQDNFSVSFCFQFIIIIKGNAAYEDQIGWDER